MNLHFTDCPVDLVILLDGSGSICNNERVDICDNWRSMRDFLARLVENVQIGGSGARVGLITFGSSATVNWLLDRYMCSLLKIQ